MHTIQANDRAAEYARRINEQFGAGVNVFVKTGQMLLEAKAELPHGQFAAMIEMELTFSVQTAQQLMSIARDQRLQMHDTVMHLPPAWPALYELTHLDDSAFELAMKSGAISPEMTRQEAKRLRFPAPADDSDLFTDSPRLSSAQSACLVAIRRVREVCEMPHKGVLEASERLSELTTRLYALSGCQPDDTELSAYVRQIESMRDRLVALGTGAIERTVNRLCDLARDRLNLQE